MLRQLTRLWHVSKKILTRNNLMQNPPRNNEIKNATESIKPENVQLIGDSTYLAFLIFRDKYGRNDYLTGHSVIINGFPQGTRFVTTWVSEWILGTNQSHFGDAIIETRSVQLNDKGQCRVHFYVNWVSDDPLTLGAWILFGPNPLPFAPQP
jgi:hypothetical protein